MTPAEFTAAWEALSTPVTNDQLEAHEVTPESGVWIARDNADHQHLLVLVDGAEELAVGETHGLSIAITRTRVAGRNDAPYVDLACLDVGAVQTFATVASDIATSVVSEPIDRRTAVVATAVREWRWFWGVDPSRLSTAEAVGLFGELWFLNRWARPTAGSVQAWEGSTGSRHDFQWATSSVEVKTTSRSGGSIHAIEHLDQLADPETGQLYVFSLRIARDALAANTLNSLVAAARHALRMDPTSRSDLMAKLAQRGYVPAGQNEGDVCYRVVDEALYRVADGFPRLTLQEFPNGLPAGVSSVSYHLDMAACGAWRTDATAGRWVP